MARAVLVFLPFPKTGVGLGCQLGAVRALHCRMRGAGGLVGPCWFHNLHILPTGGAETFHYTCQGRCTAGTDDAADLDSTRHAFSLLGTVLVGHGLGRPWGWAGLVPIIPLPSPHCWWEHRGWTPRCWGAQISAGCSHIPSLWDMGIPPALGAAPHAPAVPAGVPEADQLELFSILAAILHLGDIAIRGRDRHGDGCFVEVGESSLCLATSGPASRWCW